MNKQKFDDFIKENIADKSGNSIFGYLNCDGRSYLNYYRKDVFNTFIKEMKSKYTKAYNSYNTGKGGELVRKDRKYPPKMASVASSSRFCYLALRDGASSLGVLGEVEFEHECRITSIGGIAPQLDAYIKESNTYFEVKCHEIFDSHKVSLKAKYCELLYGEGNDFGFDTIIKADDEDFEIPLSVFGLEKESSMFDVKQLICHLLGISSQKKVEDTATLIYLFFKPKAKVTSTQEEIEETFTCLSKEIKAVFKCKPISQFITKNNIQLKAVYEYSEVMEALSKDNIYYIIK